MAVGVLFVLVSLSLPIKAWRTGEPQAPPLSLSPGQSFASQPARIWIDTDAACGHGPRSDPDDCFGILLLAQASEIEIAGVSTVFGNASLEVTDRTARLLMAALSRDGIRAAPVYRGRPESIGDQASLEATPADDALRAALRTGPLTIVALGPMSNIAAALLDRPDLQARVARIVAVMGRRRGHLFHPVEGGTARSLLGHGPVFTDFNFAKDQHAAVAVLAMRRPLTLVPYLAARHLMIDGAVLDGMAVRGGAAAMVARGSRAWLSFWREDIGRAGFYPFDLIAAAFVIEPGLLRCADVTVSVGDDTGVLGWFGSDGVFVTSATESVANPLVTAPVVYCPEITGHTREWLMSRLLEAPGP